MNRFGNQTFIFFKIRWGKLQISWMSCFAERRMRRWYFYCILGPWEWRLPVLSSSKVNTSVSLVKKEVIRGKMREPHRCDCLMPHVTGTIWTSLWGHGYIWTSLQGGGFVCVWYVKSGVCVCHSERSQLNLALLLYCLGHKRWSYLRNRLLGNLGNFAQMKKLKLSVNVQAHESICFDDNICVNVTRILL